MKTKSELNTILKELSFENVYASIPGKFHMAPKKHLFTDYSDKRFKGKLLAHHSPMDCTDVKRKKADEAINTIVNRLEFELETQFNREHGRYVATAKLGGKDHLIKLNSNMFPAYVRSEYDQGYQNEWLTVDIVLVKEEKFKIS